ncbi:MAG TPA: HDOD domain-containing protein [Planctomycetaceae bacterium]|nr:HDOD domain-containing protein [Planctomycetaceae bacterium]
MSDMDWSAIREDALAPFTLATLPPSISLPAFPHAVTRFIERSKDESASLKDLASIVETDAGLTIELLKHVNSSHIGLRTKAKTVQQALSMLGVRQSKMLLIATGTQAAVLSRKSKLINQACFWNACLQKAIFARLVAKMLKADADVAFAGALLQDYLLPVLTNDLFERYTEFIENRAQQPESLCDYERPLFGWDHATAAALLAHRWKLPDDLVCCLLFHHRGLHALADKQLGRTAVAAVALSALLPDQLRQQFNGLEQLLLLQDKWPAFQLEALVNQVDQEHGEMGMGVNNDFPLARRCKATLDAVKTAKPELAAAS